MQAQRFGAISLPGGGDHGRQLPGHDIAQHGDQTRGAHSQGGQGQVVVARQQGFAPGQGAGHFRDLGKIAAALLHGHHLGVLPESGQDGRRDVEARAAWHIVGDEGEAGRRLGDGRVMGHQAIRCGLVVVGRHHQGSSGTQGLGPLRHGHGLAGGVVARAHHHGVA